MTPSDDNDAATGPREEAWLTDVLDRLDVAVFSVDHARQVVTRTNEAYARMLGFPSAAAASGVSVLSHYADPGERQEIATRLQASPEFRATGRARLAVQRRRIDTGEPVPMVLDTAATFDDAGRVARIDCVATAEPEQRVERAVRASEERFRTVFDTSTTAMALADLDGHLVRVNAAFARFTGRDEAALLGAELRALVHPDDDPPRLEPDGRGGGPVEWRFVRAGGEVASGLVTWSWLADARGERPHSAVVVVQDLTAHKRHEEEMLRIAKLESLGLLAGGIAHDFNNVLAVILASLTVIGREVAPGSTAAQLVETAEAATGRARELAAHLLTFARGGAPSLRVGSLEAVVREAAAFCAGAWPVAIDVDVAADAPRAEFDPVQMTQVLHNLLINAVQAMPGGGRIHVGVARAVLGDDAAVPLPAGAYVRVRVRDEGPGIPAEYGQRIFDPYVSTKPGGTGLGLATVHSIVRRHRGHVGFTSTPGHGATFDVYLPATELLPAVAPASPLPSSPPPGRARLLVMDDEPQVRQVLALILRGAGYAVDAVGDGADAVALYRAAIAEGRGYDAVLLDLTVPGGVGGLDAVRRLRDLDPAVRAIVASGYAADPVLSNASSHGFCGVVRKPFTAAELEGAVAAALASGPRVDERAAAR